MCILKLKPSCKDYIWGGNRLREEYGVEYDKDILAEAWELSCHPDGPSYIVNGKYAGKTLQQYIDAEGKDVLGRHCRRFRDFPILTKFIDARDDLSIQVHPDNRFALNHEGQYGKTEMWYIMDAGKDAFLYYGFKKEISKEEFAKRIQEDTLLEVLNAVPVRKGDVLFIESGTIHAIGKNILIAEIQQNSNVTYRVYDYGRVGNDGKKRDLHIEKALAVTNRVPIVRDQSSYPHVADCDYFTVDKINLDGKVMKKMEGIVSEESFASILFLDGKGKITCGEESLEYKKGDSFFIAAGSGEYKIGYAPTCSMCYPETDKPEDIEAARQMLFSMQPDDRNWTWNVSWWSDPVLLGHYPEEGLKRYEKYLPRITEEDMKLISEPIDVYGQNIYNGRCIRMGKDGHPEDVKRYDGFPKTAIDWPVTPEALYWGPKFLYERYQKPIYITENGLSCHDTVSLDGKVHDPNRIDFLARYLHELKRAAGEVDIRGYFQWSFMDNFEWAKGYSERFGLVYVDFRTQKRILKDSAYWYRNVIQNNGEGV